MSTAAGNRIDRGQSTTATVRGGGLYAGYLAAQAVLGVVLWLTLAFSPTVRSWLELVPSHPELMDVFVFADLFLIVVGSAAGAWGIVRNRWWTVPAVAFTAGAVVYPTLYLLSWVTATSGNGVAGLALMVGTSTFTCWIAYQLWSAWTPPS